MQEKLLKMLDFDDRVVLIFNKMETKSHYANKLAISLYANEIGEIDVYKIFENSNSHPFLVENIYKKLENDEIANISDVSTKTNKNLNKLADLQVGYIDDEKMEIFLKITIKEDNRKVSAINSVNNSYFCEAILNIDKNLTVYYSNPKFSEIFSEISNDANIRSLKQVFEEVNCENMLREILFALENSKTYYIELEIYDFTKKKRWYSLNLQKIFLDNNDEKLLAHMVCIDDRVSEFQKIIKKSPEFNDISDFYSFFMFRIDLNTHILHTDSPLFELFNLPSQIDNFPHNLAKFDIIHNDDINEYTTFCLDVLNGIGGSHICRFKMLNGIFEKFIVSFKIIFNNLGKAIDAIGTIKKINIYSDENSAISTDLLTNTLNISSIKEKITCIFKKNTKNSHHAILTINLDDFRVINTELGHNFGDFILKNVAKRLKSTICENDLVCRVDGDEFVIFLESCGDEIHLLDRGIDLIEKIHKKYSDNTNCVKIHTSVGIAIYPQHGENFDTLYENSKNALNFAKNIGKNVAIIFDNDLR